MQTYQVTLTGKSPLLMHRDNIEWASEMEKWQRDPANNGKSVAGDDRTPPHRWLGCLYYSGAAGAIGIPSDNIMRFLMQGGAQVKTKGRSTFKAQTQSGMMTGEEIWPLVVGDREVAYSDLRSLLTESDFARHGEAAAALGFSLYVKRAAIGKSKHIRVRPRFDRWACSGTIVVWDDTLTLGVLRSILHQAGEYKGVGDWRPSSKTPGPFGRFSSEIKLIETV